MKLLAVKPLAVIGSGGFFAVNKFYEFSNLKLITFGTAIIGDDFHDFRSTFILFRSKVRLGQGQGRVSYYHPPLWMTASSCHAALLLAGNGVLVRGQYAAQASKGNFQKTCYKTSSSTCRPRL